MKRIAEKIEVAFRSRLEAIDRSWLDLANELGRNRRDGIRVYLTGGGAGMPFLRDMIPEQSPQFVSNRPPQFYFQVVGDAPPWAEQRGFRQTWQRVREHYPQLAVSLGGGVFGAGINQHLKIRDELRTPAKIDCPLWASWG